MSDPTKKPGDDKKNVFKSVKEKAARLKGKLPSVLSRKDPSDKKNSVLTDLKNAFHHINPKKAA